MSSPPRRVDTLREYPLGDESLVYSKLAETAVALNPSAREIFELCDGRTTVASIAQLISERYSCRESEIEPDVREALVKLRDLGLIEWDDQ